VTKDISQDPGKWTLFFDNISFPFQYWILATGPLASYPSCFKGVSTCYAWAIVSDPFRSALFILARDVAEFDSTYKNETLTFAKEHGFDHLYNKPIEIYQKSDCVYASPPV